MTTKHTPGPWHYIGIEPDYPREHSVVALNRFGRAYIARTIGGLSAEEEKANARLITAAPDLLEALQELVLAMDVVTKVFGEAPEVGSPAANARAAISKATGSSVETEGGGV